MQQREQIIYAGVNVFQYMLLIAVFFLLFTLSCSFLVSLLSSFLIFITLTPLSYKTANNTTIAFLYFIYGNICKTCFGHNNPVTE